MSEHERNLSCDLPVKRGGKADNRNRFMPFKRDYTWKGVKIQNYKTSGNDWSGIARQVLIGARGETARFQLRYFEIKEGGSSSFETHRHEHVVIGIRGEGRARINRRTVNVGFLDVLYINPYTPHKLFNTQKEPFGFFCIVNAVRDRPRPVGPERRKR